MAQQFASRIYKLGINPCVDVPKRVSDAFGKKGRVPVAGTLNGHPICATLVPVRGGRHRLFINGDMRKRADVDVGDQIGILLNMDSQPRVVPMPEEFARALRKDKRAKATFDGLPPSRQKEILVYLNWVKRPETLRRNIQKTILQLRRRA